MVLALMTGKRVLVLKLLLTNRTSVHNTVVGDSYVRTEVRFLKHYIRNECSIDDTH